jgi:hypothetical protein
MPEKTTAEDQTCIKLGLGSLGTQMDTHQPPPPSVSLLYTVTTQDGEVILGEGA